MRKLITLTLASSAVVAIACGKDKAPTTAMSADLKRDLQLASATQDIRINPDEVARSAKQELTVRPKRAPEGPRVVRTENPTVQASAAPVEAAEIKTDVPEVQVAAASPAPSETASSDAPPLARPAPLPMPTQPTGSTVTIGDGRGSSSGGIGSVIGAIIGGAVVMRGGVAGDDHCDPRGGTHRRPPDIYQGTGVRLPTGIAGGRNLPMRPISRQR